MLGAGPAGVAAAWRAAAKGASVVVLERAPVPGGAAGSFTVGGIRVDHGSHRLHGATDPAILAELRRVLGDELQTRVRNGRIRLGGRWIAFPLRAGDVVRHLPPSFAAGAAFDTLTAPARRPRRDTFDEVVRAGLGPTMWQRFYKPYAAKIWGVDPAQLSGEQARRRITADSPLKMIRRLLAGTKTPSTFFYPQSGFGTITERLADAATAAGAELRYNAAVERLSLRDDGVTVAVDDGSRIEARRAWSTLPLTLLARMADPPAPPRVTAAADQLRFRAMVLVYLVLDVPQWTAYDAHYLPEATTPITRVSEPKNYRDSPADPAARTVLCAEVPCDVGDDIWRADDDALARLVAEDLAAVGLPRPNAVEVTTRRLSHAYPIYDTGYESAFATVDAWAAQQPRLLTFGRQGLFAHDNTHHAFAMAWAAADALDDAGSFDEARWKQARKRFASHVVED